MFKIYKFQKLCFISAVLQKISSDGICHKRCCSFLNNSGYEAVGCLDAESAYDEMYKTTFDCIVSDIMMPNIDGFEFAKTVRSLNTDIPILFMTARDDFAAKQRGYRIGIDDYMIKPIEREEFLYRIKALLRRAKIAGDRRIVIGDVTVDYDSMTVRRGDEVTELPQKEFLLLYKLLSYPDRIFTRIQIMDEIWGPDSEAGWETVTVHIARLRRRFEGWEEFSIESIRGVGYKAVKRV